METDRNEDPEEDVDEDSGDVRQITNVSSLHVLFVFVLSCTTSSCRSTGTFSASVAS